MKRFTFSLLLLVLFKLNVSLAQDCNFKESGGVIAVEAESATIPNGWIVSTQQGTTYIEWDKNPSFNEPGVGAITYQLNVTTPGIYRLQIRNKVNEGTNTSNSNDSFLKLPNNDNVVFFGHKGSSNVNNIAADLQAKNANIVFPVGTGLGNPVFGPSKDGWVKVYGGSLDWNWDIETNDEDPYKVYVKFNAAGIYEMNLSAREVHHAIDKIVLYHLSTTGNDLQSAQMDGFPESANNCPKTLPTVNNADGKCEFDEFNGVIAIEAESNNIPSNWGVSLIDGTSLIEWTDKESFGKPGVGAITYTINVNTTGIYRFQWRNRVNKGTATNNNNDTWLKMPNNENIVFFGYKGNGSADKIASDLQNKALSIVFPKDTGLGNPAFGAGGDGWFKVYTGGLSFNWTTNVNDEDPYNVFVKFNQPGLYTIQISGRSQYHAIDRMVLYHLKTHLPTGGNELPAETLDGFAESGCVPKLPYTNNSQGDSLALRLLHEKTSGANWTNPWDLSKPMDQWVGVKLDTGRRVVELSLVNRGLKGPLPTELSFLSKLKKLEITGNSQLSGRIPDLDKMVDLAHLDCSNNGGLGGSLAPIGNLTKLQVIKLAHNQISGGLPANINKLTNLTTLDVSNNTLSGNLPAGISSLTKLITLNLANNALTGSIPVMNTLLALKTLDLSGNDLSGEISSLGLGSLTNLELLGLGANELTGVIFPGVVNLIKLKKLDLGDNQLTGTIPTDLGNLVALTELNLSDNQLSGPIPASLGSLINLTTALFNDNLLEGTVPSLASLTKLTMLSLQNNSFSGLPDLSASVVTDLSVENNQLTFEDILPNKDKLNSYAPQDSVGEKKDITLVAGQDLLIDLGIDDGVALSVYQWSKNGVVFANTLKSELLVKDVGAEHLGVYTCVITNSQLPELTLYSFPVIVKVNEPPVFTSTPVTTATTDTTYTYNITVNDPNADDSVSIEAITLPAWLTFKDNGDGTAVLSGKPALGDCSDNQITLRAVDRGDLDTLQSFAIDIAANFAVSLTSDKATICKGESVTFEAALSNPGENPSYQWFLNDVLLEGLNGATITTSTLKTGDVLKVKVTTDPAPCLVNTEAETMPMNIQVTDVTSMAIVLNAEQSQVCAGEPATFTTILSNPGNNPVYAWFVNETAVSEATGATFTTNSLQNGDAIKVKVTAENPGCLQNTEAESTSKTVSVINSLNLDVALTADKTEINAGDPVKFTATTAYTASLVAYQWFINGNAVAEESSATFITSTLKNNDKVKVKLTADSVPCLLNPEVESQEISMTVDAGIVLANIEKGILEGVELSFVPSDFSAAFTSGLGGLATIKITTLPTQGALQLNGTAVNVGQEIAVDKISGLVYLPNNEFSGADEFQWNGTEGTQFAMNDANVSITIEAVNDPPVFTLSRDSVIVKQGFDSTEEITVIPGEVPSSEAGQTVTYSLDPSDITFANVAIDQHTGKVSITKIGGRIGSQVVAVVADDGQAENNTYAQTFLLEIRSNLNTSPLDIQLSSINIPENQPAGSTIATIHVIDNDANDVHQIEFHQNDVYPDNTLFTIEGNALKNNEVLDFEGKNRVFLNLKATDKVGNSLTKQIVFNITDVNDPPTDIMINSLNIVENLTIGGVAAEFTTNDHDPKDQHTYALVGEAKDNSRFLITGNKLILNSTLALNRGEELQILVRVDDGREGAIDKDFSLTVISPADEFANIKTGFTPNGDEWNATWKIENIEKYPNARIEIFDSWGRRVFYSVGYEQEWDGTYEGKELPAGIYYYIIDTYTGNAVKGTITLMR